MNRIVDNIKACDPIENTLIQLNKLGFRIVEQRLWDYHFAQLEFRLKGDLKNVQNVSFEGITRVGNFLKCDCHWSTIELLNDSNANGKVN